MPNFYKKQGDANPHQVYDQNGTPLSYQAYKAAGGVGTENQGNTFTDVAANYAPLPALGGAGPMPQQTDTNDNDPITKFNMGLYSLLQGAQGVNSAPLYNERNRLDVAQTTNSMAPAADLGIGGLAPGDMISARQNQSKLYDPEINNLTDRIQASSQAVSQFGTALKAAKEYGEEMMKYVKPDPETIAAVQEMLIAGQNPGQDVLNSVAKYIDWKAVGASKAEKSSDTSSMKEYEKAKSEGFKGNFQQWLDRPSQYKATGSGDGETSGNKERTQVNSILNSFPRSTSKEPGGAADYINWEKAAAQINRELKDPNAATRYDALLKDTYDKKPRK